MAYTEPSENSNQTEDIDSLIEDTDYTYDDFDNFKSDFDDYEADEILDEYDEDVALYDGSFASSIETLNTPLPQEDIDEDASEVLEEEFLD